MVVHPQSEELTHVPVPQRAVEHFFWNRLRREVRWYGKMQDDEFDGHAQGDNGFFPLSKKIIFYKSDHWIWVDIQEKVLKASKAIQKIVHVGCRRTDQIQNACVLQSDFTHFSGHHRRGRKVTFVGNRHLERCNLEGLCEGVKRSLSSRVPPVCQISATLEEDQPGKVAFSIPPQLNDFRRR